jgi:hypothetical protein
MTHTSNGAANDKDEAQPSGLPVEQQPEEKLKPHKKCREKKKEKQEKIQKKLAESIINLKELRAEYTNLWELYSTRKKMINQQTICIDEYNAKILELENQSQGVYTATNLTEPLSTTEPQTAASFSNNSNNTYTPLQPPMLFQQIGFFANQAATNHSQVNLKPPLEETSPTNAGEMKRVPKTQKQLSQEYRRRQKLKHKKEEDECNITLKQVAKMRSSIKKLKGVLFNQYDTYMLHKNIISNLKERLSTASGRLEDREKCLNKVPDLIEPQSNPMSSTPSASNLIESKSNPLSSVSSAPNISQPQVGNDVDVTWMSFLR